MELSEYPHTLQETGEKNVPRRGKNGNLYPDRVGRADPRVQKVPSKIRAPITAHDRISLSDTLTS